MATGLAQPTGKPAEHRPRGLQPAAATAPAPDPTNLPVGEDGLAGFCDVEQRLCLGVTLWNGRDPILKERVFGLTGAEANHDEDVKEYWWYLDAVPSYAWNRWRYHYPQAAFPYEDLRRENGRRSKLDPEYELLDTEPSTATVTGSSRCVTPRRIRWMC
jgi:hypothetical protein